METFQLKPTLQPGTFIPVRTMWKQANWNGRTAWPRNGFSNLGGRAMQSLEGVKIQKNYAFNIPTLQENTKKYMFLKHPFFDFLSLSHLPLSSQSTCIWDLSDLFLFPQVQQGWHAGGEKIAGQECHVAGPWLDRLRVLREAPARGGFGWWRWNMGGLICDTRNVLNKNLGERRSCKKFILTSRRLSQFLNGFWLFFFLGWLLACLLACLIAWRGWLVAHCLIACLYGWTVDSF